MERCVTQVSLYPNGVFYFDEVLFMSKKECVNVQVTSECAVQSRESMKSARVALVSKATFFDSRKINVISTKLNNLFVVKMKFKILWITLSLFFEFSKALKISEVQTDRYWNPFCNVQLCVKCDKQMHAGYRGKPE